jgi:hypothetical protein
VDLAREQQQQMMAMAMIMMLMATDSCVVSANTSLSLANVARVQEVTAKAAVTEPLPLQWGWEMKAS